MIAASVTITQQRTTSGRPGSAKEELTGQVCGVTQPVCLVDLSQRSCLGDLSAEDGHGGVHVTVNHRGDLAPPSSTRSSAVCVCSITSFETARGLCCRSGM